MKRTVFAIAILLVCSGACAEGMQSEQDSRKHSAEEEIRAALCDLDKGDYASAQKTVERLLQTDLKNIYARKLLLFSLAAQIKPGDKSPGNIALIRKAIEACNQGMKSSQFTSEEKRSSDSFLVSFYGKERAQN